MRRTAESAREEAVALFLDQGPKHLSCTQAVVHCGLLILAEDTELSTIGTFLGGGVARMGQVCGAITGAAVTLGIRDCFAEEDSNQREEARLKLQALMRDFQDQFGGLTCGDLLGRGDLSDLETFQEAKRQGALKRCPDFVSFVCDRLIAMLAV